MAAPTASGMLSHSMANASDFACVICLDHLVDNRECPHCPAMFCFDCIKKHLKVVTKKCPSCRGEINKASSLHHSNKIQQLTDNIREPCLNGCSEEVCVGNRKDHERSCARARIHCPYQEAGCEESGPRDVVTLHSAGCAFRPVPCPFRCDDTLRYCDLEVHQLDCPEAPVMCEREGCRQPMVRRQRADHEEVCNLAIVKCPHAHYGCEAIMMRYEVPVHLTQCSVAPVVSFLRVLEERLDTQEELIAKQQRKITKLTARLAAVEGVALAGPSSGATGRLFCVNPGCGQEYKSSGQCRYHRKHFLPSRQSYPCCPSRGPGAKGCRIGHHQLTPRDHRSSSRSRGEESKEESSEVPSSSEDEQEESVESGDRPTDY